MITDYELAVLIIRACSSRNLFIKHHVITSSGTIYLRNRCHLRPDSSVLHDTQPSSPMYSDDNLCDTAALEPVQTELPQCVEGSTVPGSQRARAGRTIRQPARFKNYDLT